MKPGVPDGTMIVESSLLPSGLVPVAAITVTRQVMSVPELVMNAFEPLITHSFVRSSRTARVVVAPASEPVPGSVSPNAASASPLVSLGSQVAFCSGVPNR
nr:hypothetical protein GCM10020092_001850 [Actinoplanes digitatis]